MSPRASSRVTSSSSAAALARPYGPRDEDGRHRGPARWEPVAHRRWFDEIVFRDDGIARYRLGFRGFVPWQAVSFVCVTPAYERASGHWVASGLRPGPDGVVWPMASITRERVDRGRLSLGVVVHDRAIVPWGWHARPLFRSDDRPEPARGVFELDLKTHDLDRPLWALLDLLDDRAGFDLLCFDF